MLAQRPSRCCLLLWGAFGLLSGCSENVDRGGEAPLPTRMAVLPEDFLGDVPCRQAPGAARSYQVTVFDVTEELPDHEFEIPFALPSSGAVPCEVPVQFQFIAPGHRYVAEVSVFTIPADDLSQPAPGFPALVNDRGRFVTPDWTTTCHGTSEALAAALETTPPGDVEGEGGAAPLGVPRGAEARTNALITIRGCEPLAPL